MNRVLMVASPIARFLHMAPVIPCAVARDPLALLPTYHVACCAPSSVSDDHGKLMQLLGAISVDRNVHYMTAAAARLDSPWRDRLLCERGRLYAPEVSARRSTTSAPASDGRHDRVP